MAVRVSTVVVCDEVWSGEWISSVHVRCSAVDPGVMRLIVMHIVLDIGWLRWHVERREDMSSKKGAVLDHRFLREDQDCRYLRLVSDIASLIASPR